MRVGKGKKTALLQPDFFIGIANVLFCVWAVDCPIPNAPKRRNARGTKKLKPLAKRFPKAQVQALFLFSIIVKSAKMCQKAAFGLHLTDGGMKSLEIAGYYPV